MVEIPMDFRLCVLFVMLTKLRYVNKLLFVSCCMVEISDFKINFTYTAVNNQFGNQISFCIFQTQSLLFILIGTLLI